MPLPGNNSLSSACRIGPPILAIGLLLLWLPTLVSSAPVQPPPDPNSGSPGTGTERWYRIEMSSIPCGWMHETVRYTDDGAAELERRSEMMIRLSRFGTEISSWSRTRYTFGPTPRLLYESSQSPGDTTRLFVTFESDSLVYRKTAEGRTAERAIMRPEGLLLPDGLQALYGDPASRTSGTIRYRYFVPDLADTPVILATFESDETLSIQDSPTPALRWKVRPETLAGFETTEWRSPKGHLLRMEHAGLGIVYTLTDHEDAIGADGAAEIMITSMIAVDHIFEESIRYPRIRYRITFTDGIGSPTIPDTPSLVLLDSEPGSGVIEVRTVDATEIPADEKWEDDRSRALRSTLMIQSDDPAIRQAAQSATQESGSDWEKAVRLQRFVYDEILDKDLQVAFGSAVRTLERRQGDCTEHAILLAALTRSIGIPSRLAAGLVGLGNQMGYHLWTEVHVDGRWVGLDAALNRAPTDGRYLALAVSDLSDDSPAPLVYGLLDVVRRIRIEILDAETGSMTDR